MGNQGECPGNTLGRKIQGQRGSDKILKMKTKKIRILTIAGFLIAVIMGNNAQEVSAAGLKTAEPSNLVSHKVFYQMPAAGEGAIIYGTLEEETQIKDTITIGAVGNPALEILEYASGLLKEKGYHLEIREYEDYELINQKVLEAEIDGNLFQHFGYLERYNIEKGTVLQKKAEVYFHPMAIYGGKTEELSKLKKGSKILVPEDTTGYARALHLLSQEGFLTLMEDADLMAVEGDILENPYGLTLIKTKEEEMWAKSREADLIICQMAYALKEGVLPDKEALAKENEDSMAASYLSQLLVVQESTGEKIKPLAEVLVSKEMEKFITSYFHGTLSFIGTMEETGQEAEVTEEGGRE